MQEESSGPIASYSTTTQAYPVLRQLWVWQVAPTEFPAFQITRERRLPWRCPVMLDLPLQTRPSTNHLWFAVWWWQAFRWNRMSATAEEDAAVGKVLVTTSHEEWKPW